MVQHPQTPILPWLLALLVVVLMCAGLTVGPAAISFGDILRTPWLEADDPISIVVLSIRLPRVLLGLLVGASLGMAGAALQGLLRNPLAEPGIIGVSGSAAFAAVLVFYTGLAGSAIWILPVSGIAGALLSVILLYALAGSRQRGGMVNLILAGVAINALAGALTSLTLNLSPNPFAAYEIFFWLLGSLSNRSMTHVYMVLPCIVTGLSLLYVCRHDLDTLALGEDTAVSLGLNLARLRWMVIVGTALAVGGAVAVSGVVGFVGLVVPHLLRARVRYRPAALVPMSALGGAALVLAADIGTRIPLATGELKLGVVTALLGAPFFIHLVLRGNAR